MEEKSLVICFVVVLVNFSAFVRGKCPCEDKALCETIARPQGKEFLMFSTKPNDWKKYDWTKVTTIALFRPWDDELMCEAHKRVSVLVNSYLVALFSPVRKLSALRIAKRNSIFSSVKLLVPKSSDFICMEFVPTKTLLS